MLCGSFMFPKVWREFRAMSSAANGWAFVLVLSAGWANFGYVLAVLQGEVMRVLLLFYLAPLWTILFSYWLLGERLNIYGYLIIALSLSGAFTMLWDPRLGLPLPNNVSEWIGLSAGMGFALSNVVSRRAEQLSCEAKSYSVWFGTLLLSAPLLLWQGNIVHSISAINVDAWLILILLGIVLCAISYTVQYSIAFMPANRAIILFLFELVVAAVSSYFLADEAMHLREWIGALLIISASLMSGKLYSE
jgi:drug/metabolite transporter (DMT)-like permease